jgi:hypothetical protein
MPKITKLDVPFTQVANEVLNDKKISWKAKGLFAYLYSKPQGWNFAGERIVADGTDKKAAVFSGLKELEEAGYLDRKKLKSGRVEYLVKFSKKPITENKEEALAENKPIADFAKEGKSQLAKIGTISNKEKETKKEEDKEGEAPAWTEVNEIIDLFKAVNPSWERLFKNSTERQSAARLLNRYGREWIEKIVAWLPRVNGQPYAPTVTSPWQLESKIAALKAYADKQRSIKGREKIDLGVVKV